MNPGWIPAVVIVALQFGSVVWWAATTSADRRHARDLDEKRDALMQKCTQSIEALAKTAADHETRLQLVEKLPQQGRRQHGRS